MTASLSPCIGRCRLDEHKVCIGCLRTIDEIGRWGLLSVDEQRRILRQIEGRRQPPAASVPSSAFPEPSP